MLQEEIKSAIKPLRLIFWGGIFCVLDITFSQTVNGRGWKLDILDDLIGALMITWGVAKLARLPVNERYRAGMNFAFIVAILNCADAFQDHFIYRQDPIVSILLSLLGVVVMIAILVFCFCMQKLSLEAKLVRSHQSWKLTTILFLIIYVIPLGFFYLAGVIAIATQSSFHVNAGPVGLLILIPIFFIPLIHLFVSTSRMRGEAE